MRFALVSFAGGGSCRYRCDHRAEMLELAGATAAVLPSKPWNLDSRVTEFDCIILHRPPTSKKLARLLWATRRARTPVVFDTDDLIFDPTLENSVPWGRKHPIDVRLEKLLSRRRAMAACDAVTVSTEPLRTAARAVNPHVAVLPNAVAAAMVTSADDAMASTRGRSEDVVIGYFSGTATHDRDFLEAAGAVEAVLDAASNARLLIVGPLEVDRRFDRFGRRIERLERRPFEELARLVARADVAIAPLESGSRFTDAKSSVKYLEAALVAVPVVASPTSDFARVIRDGVNGMLARTAEHWRLGLLELVTSPQKRESLGRAAWADVRANHTTAARAEVDGLEFGALLGAARGSRFSPPGLISYARRRPRWGR